MSSPSVFFKDKSEFRKWFEKNHDKETELSVGFYKVGSGKQNMTWSDAVDEALCFGWIDGVRHSIDENSYRIRFTPRKPTSNWSEVNLKKMKYLMENNLVHSSGLKIFEFRNKEKTKNYSFENKTGEFEEGLKNIFISHVEAWNFYNSLAHSYQKTTVHWVQSAKQEATRIKRLHTIIDACNNHVNIWKNTDFTRKK
jgi:uncharacterized protein YdeI (YjbR/CyaY-like superfamily)